MNDQTTIDHLVDALKPFSILCEMHDDEKYADTDGVIFPGSKAAIVVGDLRRAHRAYEEIRARRARDKRARADLEASERTKIKPECPACGTGYLERFQTHIIAAGISASIRYDCGHTFSGETLKAALV